MTKIQWTDEVWNCVRGCSRVSRGCEQCYAERQAIRHSGPGRPYEGLARMVNGHPVWTGKVRCLPELLDKPLHWRKPRRVFVNSMSDLFHESVSFQFIGAVFGAMASTPQHTFQILTKRPARMLRWFEWFDAMIEQIRGFRAAVPRDLSDLEVRVCINRFDMLADRPFTVTYPPWPLPNVHHGVSVEDQKTADERIPLLLRTPAAVRFLSVEPLLEGISLRWLEAWPNNAPTTAMNPAGRTSHLDGLRRLDWVIVGCESGPKRRPFDLQWARDIIDQCAEAGVPVFIKQIPVDGKVSTDPAEWPEDLRVREWPREG